MQIAGLNLLGIFPVFIATSWSKLILYFRVFIANSWSKFAWYLLGLIATNLLNLLCQLRVLKTDSWSKFFFCQFECLLQIAGLDLLSNFYGLSQLACQI